MDPIPLKIILILVLLICKNSQPDKLLKSLWPFFSFKKFISSSPQHMRSLVLQAILIIPETQLWDEFHPWNGTYHFSSFHFTLLCSLKYCFQGTNEPQELLGGKCYVQDFILPGSLKVWNKSLGGASTFPKFCFVYILNFSAHQQCV